MTATRWAGLTIRSTNMRRDAEVYAAVTGIEPTPAAMGPDSVAFHIGDASVTLASGSDTSKPVERGIERLVLEVAELDLAMHAARNAGADILAHEDRFEIDRSWAGVHIEMRSRKQYMQVDGGVASAVLDHVALLFSDLEVATRRWSALLGTLPAHTGVHPLGTSIAARFLLGDRMIELLAPPADGDSPLRSRLERAGDGPFAVAIIATDLDATVARIEATGARLVVQPPHLIVHPADASGVPIQLTPRVHH